METQVMNNTDKLVAGWGRKFGDVSLAIAKLRVNAKSLANEARFIRQETAKTRPENRGELAAHRRGRLREEARLAYLALAFLRNRPYRSVEAKGSNPVSALKLASKLLRTGVIAEAKESLPKLVSEWLQ